MPGQIRRLNWALDTVRIDEGKTVDLPSTETPVVALHCVGLVGGLRRAKIITEVAIGIEGMPVSKFKSIVHHR